jgi:hypothetical protein
MVLTGRSSFDSGFDRGGLSLLTTVLSLFGLAEIIGGMLAERVNFDSARSCTKRSNVIVGAVIRCGGYFARVTCKKGVNARKNRLLLLINSRSEAVIITRHARVAVVYVPELDSSD